MEEQTMVASPDHILQVAPFQQFLGYVVQTIVGTTMKKILLEQNDRKTLK